MQRYQNLASLATRAPEAGDGAEGNTVTAPVKQKVAEHALVNANGEVVEDEELATGISYKQVASGDTFVWQVPDAVPGSPATMLAIFGAKTLATNESSQIRNNPKGGGSDAEQMQAIRDRFGLIETGKWVDRTREGVGARVDKDKLAEAIVSVLVADGKVPDDQAPAFIAKVRAKLESDAGYLRTSRTVPGVNDAYARLMGRGGKTTDDLLASIG